MSTTTTALLMLLAETAHEGHGAGHGEVNWFSLGSQLFNFALFFGFLVFVLRKPLQAYLETRRETMAVQMREAEKKQAEAEQKLAEYAHKLNNLESEVSRIVQSFEAQGRVDRERLQLDTDKAIDRLVREVDFTIRQETLKSQNLIRETGAQATIKLAEQLINERITDADRRRLADEYIGQVAAHSAGKN